MPDITSQVCQRRYLRILSHNVQGLSNKIPRIESILQTSNNYDVLVITEHWMRFNEISVTHVMNFNLASSYCRPNRIHGGVCIYVRDNLTVLDRLDLCKFSVEMHFEACAIHIIDINLVVISIYRSSAEGDFDVFTRQLELLLLTLIHEDAHVLFLGDFNVDILENSKQRTQKRKILGLFSRFNLSNFVNFLTRENKKTGMGTCLDHAYTDIPLDRVKASSVDSGIGDHKGVCVEMAIDRTISTTRHTEKRLISPFNLEQLINKMSQTDWGECAYYTGVFNFDKLFHLFLSEFQAYCPVRKIVVRPKETCWFNSEARDSKEHLLLLNMLSKYHPNNQELQQHYLAYKCRHNTILYNIRKCYFNRMIELSTNKSATVWNIAKIETNKGRQTGDTFDVLRRAVCGPSGSGSGADDDRRLAQALNDHYLAVVRDTPQRPHLLDAMSFLRASFPRVLNSLYFSPFTLFEISKLIKRIKLKSTKDIYGMPTSILSKLPTNLLEGLCVYFNESICNGIYPNSLKKIKVTPVYKGKGSKKELKSYRPISLVPVLSKVFEMGICTRLTSFLSRNELLCDQQYAYQKGRSTTAAARQLVRTVLGHLECRHRVAAIFFDLSRAFDLVDHELVVAKLEHYGVRGIGLDIVKSFLTDRFQVTQVGSVCSGEGAIGDRSVPQGSNVGNTIFNVIMNDLPFVSSFVDFVMYADDICAIVNARDDQELHCHVQFVIGKLASWFTANGMQLNVEKTGLIRFSLKSSLELVVLAENAEIKATDCVRFVGFVFDRGLQWESHIDALCSKLNSAYYAISRLSRTLSKRNLLTAYYGYFHSHIAYGIDLWGFAADRDRPFILQKKVVRMMSRVPPDEPARQLFIDLGIMTVPSLFIFEVAKYVRRNLSVFTVAPRLSARRGFQLTVPTHRLNKSAHSLHIIGPRIYNRLPRELKNVTSDAVFIKKLKCLLVYKAYYSVKEFFDE